MKVSTAGGGGGGGISAGSRSTSSLSNQIPSAAPSSSSTRPPTLAQPTNNKTLLQKDEGISPPNSPYPAPQIVSNGECSTVIMVVMCEITAGE